MNRGTSQHFPEKIYLLRFDLGIIVKQIDEEVQSSEESDESEVAISKDPGYNFKRYVQSVPHFVEQGDLNDLARDLNLSKQESAKRL